jgi:hypothetical protein
MMELNKMIFDMGKNSKNSQPVIEYQPSPIPDLAVQESIIAAMRKMFALAPREKEE